VSDGIAPGSIQVPGNGQPIVLLVDRQTAGGYPKIATVISADMPALGRMPIGSKISFEPVSLETAQELRRRFVADIANIGERIVPVRRSAAHAAPMLFDCNLISGVVDARGWM
jgi:allophanate hydrolase subunit 2